METTTNKQWYAVWVAPNDTKNGYTQELVLVKSYDKESAQLEAEDRLVRRYRNTRDFHGYASIATKEDFERFKSGNKWEWIENNSQDI